MTGNRMRAAISGLRGIEPVALDGIIATAAALVTPEVCPAARAFMVAAHRSVEMGHLLAQQRLETQHSASAASQSMSGPATPR